MAELPLTHTMYSISILISYVIFSSSEQKKKMIPYVTCRVPLRVFAPTVIPVCDHWNRGKTEVLSAQDRQTQIQGQTNIRPLPRLITRISRGNISRFQRTSRVFNVITCERFAAMMGGGGDLDDPKPRNF